VGILYVCLNAVSAATIFGFGHYEGKLGGPWDNMLLDAMVHVPVAALVGVGYFGLVAAHARGRAPVDPWRPVAAAAIAAALAFAPVIASDPFPDAPTGLKIALAVLYLLGIGALVAPVNWWPRRRDAKAG